MGRAWRFRRNGRFTSRPLKGIPASASVRALLCAGDTVWAGTSDGLIRIRGGDRGNDQRLFTVKDGLADDFVFSLAQGSAGTIWIGTRNGFSRLRDGNLDSFRPQDGLSQSTAIAMFEDREGTAVGGHQARLEPVRGRARRALYGQRRTSQQRGGSGARRPRRRGLGRHSGSRAGALRRAGFPDFDHARRAGVQHRSCRWPWIAMARCGPARKTG